MPVGQHITETRRARIRAAIAKDPSDKNIAARLQTSASTVRTERLKMIQEGLETAVYTDPDELLEMRDAAFWRRKALEATKRAEDCDTALRELAGMAKRELRVPNWTILHKGKTGKAIGLIHASDLHVGEVVRPEEIGGLNKYDPETFQKRFRRLITAARTILPRWAADCDLKGVVLALNGDLISGNIHAELRETNALTAHDQVALATDELAGGIAMLAAAFGKVLVTVTPGNHGRTTEKSHAKRLAALSYDTLIGNNLVRHFAADKRVTVSVAQGADLNFDILGWSILQTHGDSSGTGGGAGFAGPDLPIVRGAKKVALAGFATGQHYDLILSGHYHRSSNPGKVLANGSMVGFNEFALTRIRAEPEPPMQWLGLITDKWGLRERMPVVLEDPRRL